MHHFTLIRLWLNYYFLHTSCLLIPLNALLNLFFQISLSNEITLCTVYGFFSLDSWIRPSKYLLHVGLASNTSCITLDFLRYLHEWLSEHTCFIPQPHLPCCLLWNLCYLPSQPTHCSTQTIYLRMSFGSAFQSKYLISIYLISSSSSTSKNRYIWNLTLQVLIFSAAAKTFTYQLSNKVTLWKVIVKTFTSTSKCQILLHEDNDIGHLIRFTTWL